MNTTQEYKKYYRENPQALLALVEKQEKELSEIRSAVKPLLLIAETVAHTHHMERDILPAVEAAQRALNEH